MQLDGRRLACLLVDLDGFACLSLVAVLGCAALSLAASRFQISDYPWPETDGLKVGPWCVISLVLS